MENAIRTVEDFIIQLTLMEISADDYMHSNSKSCSQISAECWRLMFNSSTLLSYVSPLFNK
jgi:hypothetical protein